MFVKNAEEKGIFKRIALRKLLIATFAKKKVIGLKVVLNKVHVFDANKLGIYLINVLILEKSDNSIFLLQFFIIIMYK